MVSDSSPQRDNHYEENGRWRNDPGILELIEAGAPLEEIGRQPLPSQATTRGARSLEDLVQWLKGFRADQIICVRKPIWVPLIKAWPAPGGTFDFSYKRSETEGRSAEVRVVAVGGWGGGSSRSVEKEIRWSDLGGGRSLSIRAFVTVSRYLNRRTGEQLDRVDIDCSDELGEYKYVDLPESDRPFTGLSPSLTDIRKRRYTVTDIQRCNMVRAPAEISITSKEHCQWSFGPELDVSLLQSSLKLQVSSQRSTSFSTTFSLPGGHDYAFCSPLGEAPVVPVCVSIAVAP